LVPKSRQKRLEVGRALACRLEDMAQVELVVRVSDDVAEADCPAQALREPGVNDAVASAPGGPGVRVLGDHVMQTGVTDGATAAGRS
jgi:hypothetical protein